MKRALLILIVFILMIGLVGCTSEKQLYEVGSYTGVGEGHHGPIKVIVTTDEYNIIDIDIVEEYEMPELAVIVYEEIPSKIIKTNNANIEVVAGASYTSEGLIQAIEDALSKAIVSNK